MPSESRQPRPKDMRRSPDLITMTVRDKNKEVEWVISELRKVYSAYRHAEHALRGAEEKGEPTRLPMAMFNKAQFQLEYMLGCNTSIVTELAVRQMRWLTPEMEQMRLRALGKF